MLKRVSQVGVHNVQPRCTMHKMHNAQNACCTTQCHCTAPVLHVMTILSSSYHPTSQLLTRAAGKKQWTAMITTEHAMPVSLSGWLTLEVAPQVMLSGGGSADELLLQSTDPLYNRLYLLAFNLMLTLNIMKACTAVTQALTCDDMAAIEGRHRQQAAVQSHNCITTRRHQLHRTCTTSTL